MNLSSLRNKTIFCTGDHYIHAQSVYKQWKHLEKYFRRITYGSLPDDNHAIGHTLGYYTDHFIIVDPNTIVPENAEHLELILTYAD